MSFNSHYTKPTTLNVINFTRQASDAFTILPRDNSPTDQKFYPLTHYQRLDNMSFQLLTLQPGVVS
jgi:hypothetical protein